MPLEHLLNRVQNPPVLMSRVDRINSSVLEHVVTTDSIQETDAVNGCDKIIHITIAPLFAKAIRRIHEESSVSVLFS